MDRCGGGLTRAQVERLIKKNAAPPVPPSSDYIFIRSGFIANVNIVGGIQMGAWDTVVASGGVGLSLVPTGVQVGAPGDYLVSATVLCSSPGTGQRVVIFGQPTVNGSGLGLPFVISYLRKQEGHERNAITLPASVLTAGAGDTLGMRVGRDGTASFPASVNNGDAFMFVQRLP